MSTSLQAARRRTIPRLPTEVTSGSGRPAGASSAPRPRAPTLVAAPAPPAAGSHSLQQTPVRARVGTLAAWPAPPPPSSSVVRARLPSIEGLDDADILEVVALPPRRRPRDAMAVLREDIGELEHLGTAWQVAALCAAALAKATGARAVFIHSHNARAREMRVMGVSGAKTHNLLGGVEAVDDDFVASALVSHAEPMTMRFDGDLPRLAPARLSVVGASRSLVAVPAMASGSCVAIVEVVDADEARMSRSTEACRYVAEQLAQFLAARAAAA